MVNVNAFIPRFFTYTLLLAERQKAAIQGPKQSIGSNWKPSVLLKDILCSDPPRAEDRTGNYPAALHPEPTLPPDIRHTCALPNRSGQMALWAPIIKMTGRGKGGYSVERVEGHSVLTHSAGLFQHHLHRALPVLHAEVQHARLPLDDVSGGQDGAEGRGRGGR